MSSANHIAGGLKATLKNPNVSEEAKERALDRLENEDFSTTADESEKTTEAKNPGNVIGGMKAALKNPNVSDSKKEELQSKLEEF
ncbi:uncharacterized protein MELLADRAFT_73948 [Melampsora larici-populina 98AG31]|uniref:Conidiation protein 6 n=1 Tax=Melampsora larici-populina (strain 98AG31 / pathotype 3-4-7) TaxID=747676 RepID=F4R516_MELLP|nr:uncharacterized protein MELLADRAFT_73948 [Melampsora larici-populina 98AG31]EGG11980.1 hypothetical protein MELLADRAFT_73948 [Melampsora larici-populina 98AG31]